MDTDAMQSPAGDNSMKNKRNKRKERKKVNKTDELLNMNQMENSGEVPSIGKHCIAVTNDLQNNLIEIDSTPLSQPQSGPSGVPTRSTETVPGSTVQQETRKRKRKKKQAKNEGEFQSRNQMDGHFKVPPIGIASNNDVKNNLIELDSTAQSHVEPCKMDTRSLTLRPGGTVVTNIKKTKRKEKKVQNAVEVRQMDDNLEVPDIGKLCIAANTDLNSNIIESDSPRRLQMEQSKLHTTSTDNITGGTERERAEGTQQRKKGKKKRNKMKAKHQGDLQSFDQINDHYAGTSFPGAHSDLPNNAMELDSTVHLHVEQSQMDTRSMSAENITEGTEGTGQRKKTKKKRNKTKVKNEGDLQSMDQTDDHYAGKEIPGTHSDLPNNAMDLDSTVQSHVEQSKMDSMSIQNITEGERTEESKQRKKRKKRRNKTKAKNEGAFHSVAEMDDHHVGKTLPGTHNDLQNNLMEQSKMDTRSIENISEGSEQKKKGRRHKNRKAKNKGELRSVDQMDDNLAVPSVGVGCTVANCDLQRNLTGLDCAAQLHAEQSKTDTRSTEHLVQVTLGRKKRKPKKTKAENKAEIQHLDKTDDKLEVPSTRIDLSCSVAHDSLQNNLTELDSTAQLHPEQSKLGTSSTENCVEGIAWRKRKRRDRNKMRVNAKDELESAAIMSTPNLFDTNSGIGNDSKPKTNESTTSSLGLVQDTVSPVGLNKEKTPLAPIHIVSKTYPEFLEPGSGPLEQPREMEIEMFTCENQHLSLPVQVSGENGNIMNESDEEEIIVYQGKNSAACNSGGVEVTKHLSSSILKKDHLSNDSSLHPEIPSVAFVKRKLLVLDVNGLLADIVMPAPKDCVPHTRMLGRAVFRRPFCRYFLKFCFQNFDVAIWSSRSKRIIDKVVDYLLGDLQHKLLFCWDMSHSTQTEFKTLENKHKPLVMKELKKIWEKNDPTLPWERRYYDESNTLLLDDSPYKALLNPPHTAIFPYSYQYKDEGDNSLGPGGSLRVYLEGVLNCDNVKDYVEQHPFGQGAIDETHPSWTFYSSVLNSVSVKSV